MMVTFIIKNDECYWPAENQIKEEKLLITLIIKPANALGNK